MKAILISIKPQYCGLIAAGKKTIEVRKTKPKLKTPFICYIYCTNDRNNSLWVLRENLRDFVNGKATAIFQAKDCGGATKANGKVIGEYICTEIEEFRFDALDQAYIMREAYGYSLDEEFKKGTCVSYKEAHDYCSNLTWNEKNTDVFYGWHISNLVIYDEPKELYDFIKPCTDPYQYCQGCKHGHINYPSDVETYEDLSGCCFDTVCLNRIRKAPQSWCYVEEVKNG